MSAAGRAPFIPVYSLALACAVTGCERHAAVAPEPQRVPPEVARLISESGRQGPVAVGLVYDAERRSLGSPSVYSAQQLERFGRRIEPNRPEVASLVTSSADFADPYYIAQPGGEFVNGRWVNYYTRGADNQRWVIWYFVCALGGSQTLLSRAFVDAIWNTPVLGTGGRLNAHPAQKPVQQHARRSGMSAFDPAWPAYPSVFTDTVYGNIASGDEWYRMAWTDSTAGSGCRGLSTTEVRPVATRYGWWFLTPMATTASLTVPPPDSDHDNVAYAEPVVVQSAYRTGEIYRSLPGSTGPAEMTAASLRFGGLNDIDNNWSYRPLGQELHRIGTDVDFDGPTRRSLDLLLIAGSRADAPIRRQFANCEGHPRRAPTHVHCQLMRYGRRPQ